MCACYAVLRGLVLSGLAVIVAAATARAYEAAWRAALEDSRPPWETR